MQNRSSLRNMIFLSLCCLLGLFGKRLINPFANPVTEALHIPGGISTAFSLMFLVIAAGITGMRFGATLMGIVQSALALGFGMVGSMGMLAPVAYILPGVVIDLVMWGGKRRSKTKILRLFIANILASVCAALTADLLVFHLPLPPLFLYLCVAALSGAVCGYLAWLICGRLEKILNIV